LFAAEGGPATFRIVAIDINNALGYSPFEEIFMKSLFLFTAGLLFAQFSFAQTSNLPSCQMITGIVQCDLPSVDGTDSAAHVVGQNFDYLLVNPVSGKDLPYPTEIAIANDRLKDSAQCSEIGSGEKSGTGKFVTLKGHFISEGSSIFSISGCE
jgi:hypothetical protein